MLSLILFSFDSQLQSRRREAIVRSLASLVSCAVDGLVADAALVGPAGEDLQSVADEAGCALFEALQAKEGILRALQQARRDDVFLFSAGCTVDDSFIDAARDAMAFGGLAAPRVLRLAPSSLLTRLAPNLAPAVGLLAAKSAMAAAVDFDLRNLARRLRAKELPAQARQCL